MVKPLKTKKRKSNVGGLKSNPCHEHRCNLDGCPELMSRNQRIVQRGWLIWIPHEDKVDVTYFPNQHIVLRGWRILIPHEDKVDVVSPFSVLVIGGGGFCSLMKIMLM